MKGYQAFALVFGAIVGGGVLGLLGGYCFGVCFPGYYHALLPRHPAMSIDTGALGAGNGVVLGVALSGSVALALLVLRTWRERPTSTRQLDEILFEVRELRRMLSQRQQVSDPSAAPPPSRGQVPSER